LKLNVVFTAALATIASIVAGAPSHASLSSANPPGRVRLSNETTFTRWAYAVTRGTAYARPSSMARRVGRLRFRTEDGFPEVYIALESVQDVHGTTWVRLRLPQRPNHVTGWAVRSALGDLHLVHTKPTTPTPAGSFWIREKFRVAGSPLYGARSMGTAAYSTTLTDWPGGGIVGLHGTSEPGLIPGRPSHGCVRLKNRDIERLYALTPVGTPLLIK
jgi:hypothetical protein